jgi:hypothetical protein
MAKLAPEASWAPDGAVSQANTSGRAPERWGPHADRWFFVGMAVAVLVTVFVGFAPTYYLLPWLKGVTVRGAAGGSSLTPLVHVHAVVFSAWTVLFLVQTGLIATRRTRVHRRLGVAGLFLAAAVVVLGIGIAIYSARLDNTPPGWTNAAAFLPVPLTSIALFLGFVTAGSIQRRRADFHKRLMLLATISLTVPALARIVRMADIPLLPTGVWGALIIVNLFLVAMMVYDVGRLGRLHRATAWGIVVFLVSWPFRLLLGDTAAWQAFAATLIEGL